jgi:recombination protein RecT
MSKEISTKNFFSQDSVKKKFEELLGKNSKGFITSVLQVTTTNNLLAKADPKTVYSSAMMAAILNLPINNNLGFAWIVPYKGQAQFQMGWRGFVQLAHRTGEYKSINVIEVYENQFVKFDKLTEEFTHRLDKDPEGEIIGYVGRFELNNGFSKTVYWNSKKVQEHAKKYSQSYGMKSSPWTLHFDEMAKKTVLKNMLSKYGPLSLEMQNAVISDQAVINDAETIDVDYVDGTNEDTPSVQSVEEKKKEMQEEGPKHEPLP